MGIFGLVGQFKAKARQRRLIGTNRRRLKLEEKAKYSQELEEELNREKKAQDQIDRTNQLQTQLRKKRFQRFTGPLKKIKNRANRPNFGLSNSNTDLFAPTKSRDELFGPSKKKKGSKGLWDL